MTCKCYSEIEGKLKTRVKEQAPAGSEQIEVELGGYVFAMSGNELQHRAACEVSVRYMTPKKAGGMKKVSQKSFVRASFCPFCGNSYEPKTEAATE